MHQEPVSPDPGPSCPEWMDDPAYLAMRAEDEDPGDLDLDDPDDDPPPDVDDDELIAEAERITASSGAGKAPAYLSFSVREWRWMNSASSKQGVRDKPAR